MHARSLRTVLGMTLAPLVGAAWLVAGASAQAAQEPQPPQQPSQQREQPTQPVTQGSAVTSTQVQDKELEAFVKSVQQVNEIKKSQSSASDQQAKDQANQKMVSIIQACGMSAERYNELARAVSSDPQLSQRFQTTQKELTDKHDLTCGGASSGDKH